MRVSKEKNNISFKQDDFFRCKYLSFLTFHLRIIAEIINKFFYTTNFWYVLCQHAILIYRINKLLRRSANKPFDFFTIRQINAFYF